MISGHVDVREASKESIQLTLTSFSSLKVPSSQQAVACKAVQISVQIHSPGGSLNLDMIGERDIQPCSRAQPPRRLKEWIADSNLFDHVDGIGCCETDKLLRSAAMW